MAYVSRRPPKIPDSQISRVRFQALACPPWAFPWLGEVQTLVHVHPCHSWFAHSLASSSRHLRTPGFIKPGRLADREGRQVSRAPLPNSGVTSVGEACAVSWEGVTPPSSLILAHAPLPLGSLLLRLLASFGESLQVVTSPCCPRQLPDVIPENFPWMLDPYPGGTRCARACFLPRRHRPSPRKKLGRLP